MNEIYGKIEEKGLNLYFGFIHRDAEKHPTLASDLIGSMSRFSTS